MHVPGTVGRGRSGPIRSPGTVGRVFGPHARTWHGGSGRLRWAGRTPTRGSWGPYWEGSRSAGGGDVVVHSPRARLDLSLGPASIQPRARLDPASGPPRSRPRARLDPAWGERCPALGGSGGLRGWGILLKR